MKKIISILFASIIFTTSAFAGGLVGVKFGQGELEATKKSVVNVTPSPDDVGETNSIDNIYGAIFAEVNLNESPVNLGFELVPLTGTVSVVNDDSDASVELSNLKTIYALAAKELDNGASVYAKIGYSHADIDNAKQSSGNNTINSFDDALEGPTVGIGFQSPENSRGLVFRAEATHSEFDDVQVKTTRKPDNLVETKKANDITFQTFTISVAKTF
tara:strand:+ start:614 stop:1261 length:648 start_codon:yes stop_codon:yes gene_type:complete